MSDPSLIEKLKALEPRANSGRGLSVLREVIRYLERGNDELAALTVQSEWDKFETHKEVADVLVSAGLYQPLSFDR